MKISKAPESPKPSGFFCSSSDGFPLPSWFLHSTEAASEHPVTTDRSCSKENQGLLNYAFPSSALFFSSSGSNGNSSSWSSLALEGDLYEDNLSFPTSDRLVQSRNLKTDESFPTNAWCHIHKRMWVTVPIYINLLFSYILTWFCLINLHLIKNSTMLKIWLTSNCKMCYFLCMYCSACFFFHSTNNFIKKGLLPTGFLFFSLVFVYSFISYLRKV